MDSRSLKQEPRTEQSPVKADTATPGKLLGERFELVELVTDGGTSLIYKATDIAAADSGAGDPIVAVKMPHESHGAPLAAALTNHEALLCRQLSHENIVRVFDVHTDGECTFLTMEWLVGETLSAALLRRQNRGLPRRQAEQIICAVADALDYCHRHGVVHSDVKPGNIFLTEHGTPKLLDFATARYLAGHEQGALSTTPSPAFTGYSPAYASPQVLNGMPPATTDDIFSLACVAYQVLTGRHPFDGIPADEAQQQGIRPPTPPGLSRWQSRVLRKGLSFEANQRPESVTAFTQALTRAERLPTFALVSAAAVAAVSVSVWQFGPKASDLFLQENAKAAVSQQAPGLEEARKAVRGSEPQRLPQALEALETLPQVERDAALRTLRGDVLSAVDNHLQSRLPEASDAADYDDLIKWVDQIGRFYPDSAKLADASSRINTEREAWVDALRIEFQRSWSSTEFDDEQAAELRELALELHSLGVNVNAYADGPTLDRYREALRSAIDDADFQRVTELARFQQQLRMMAGLRQQQQEVGEDAIQGAQRLTAFVRLKDRTPAQFPRDAAKLYFGDHLDALQQRAKSTWKTKPLVAVKEELSQLPQPIPEDFEPYAAVKETLITRFEAKERYYTRHGNDERAEYFSGILDELGADG